MTGNESTQIPPHGENVFHWERTDIEEAFKPLDPQPAHDAAMSYSNAATSWDQGLETFARSVQGSIAEAWEGSAADKAKDAITRYTKDAHNLTPLITQLSNDMQSAAESVRSVANGIPEANHHSWTANVWPPRASAEEKTRSEATAGARNAMLENYVNKFAEYDARVPVLPTALDPTNPLDISGPTKPGGVDPGTHNPSGPGTSNGPTSPSENPDQNKPGDKSTDQPTSSDTNPTSTNPSSTPTTPSTPDPSKSDTPTTPSGTQPSGTPAGIPGKSGSPSGSGTPGQSNTPSPGRSVAGLPGTPTGVNPAAAKAAAGASGRAGMSGMGGGGAGKGKSDEENTHKIPDYLINAANTEELIGEVPRTVPGGVIGADPEPPPPPSRN